MPHLALPMPQPPAEGLLQGSAGLMTTGLFHEPTPTVLVLRGVSLLGSRRGLQTQRPTSSLSGLWSLVTRPETCAAWGSQQAASVLFSNTNASGLVLVSTGATGPAPGSRQPHVRGYKPRPIHDLLLSLVILCTSQAETQTLCHGPSPASCKVSQAR